MADFESKFVPEFDFSLSTTLRIAFCFENADDNRRQNLHKERFLELQTALTNLAPFMIDVEKKTGKITYRVEYGEVKKKEEKVYKAFNEANVKNKAGKLVFLPNVELIQALNDFDEYLRIVAMRYKLYMRIDDDADTPPIARTPRINTFGRGY